MPRETAILLGPGELAPHVEQPYTELFGAEAPATFFSWRRPRFSPGSGTGIIDEPWVRPDVRSLGVGALVFDFVPTGRKLRCMLDAS